ncbi:MAG: propionyl-CoA carboxylase [Rubrivivax sp.]|uniref:acyl-CoA carboxylase subunit beta n=1 Tax=Ottowia sp. TaxID=1898956 RepID=UPI0011D32CDB|nr:carboxyl transferase domain-containing protein [Ottowia sp.]MCC6814251.1 propionyl-CoA carboxylase [Rubrivivax sp.]TXI21206.1 MAG: propionyl-CoA carboxylase [Ottowia sp.]HNE59652.1 carboxyl transferase domain-containing protein [Ottowia sp.]HNI84216.1 carboxyl transferase domain-containing protein [Ottowia sp.]HNL40882.1 carboxyl transferase domain-containing protein [Ottowia sp.]
MSAQQGQTLAPAGEWAAELAELQQRRASALAMGGAQALARMRDSGRMNARERIAALIDQGSFHEMGTLAGKGHYDAQGRYSHTDPTNAIVGTGRIDGRKVALHVDDYSIRAGSSEGTIADKWIYIERLAHQLRMPLVRLVDSAGGSVKLLMQLGGTKIPEYTTWPAQELLQTVPVVGVALGACAGQGAVKVLSSHFSVLVRGQAQVMAAGPHVVRQAYGVEVDKNELGGHLAQRKSALVHNEAEDEADALAQVRRFLSYLPRSVHELAPVVACDDDPHRADDWLKDAVPRDRRKIYDPRRILAAVFDQGSLFEIGRWQGGSLLTLLGRLNGVPVGVIANDPKVQGGAMTLQAAYKMERHTRLCSQFGLPVVNFVDQPGNATGLEAELAGTLLGAVRLGEALAHCRSPWVSILMRRCFGMAGALHGPKGGARLNHRFAWPSARWGSIPIEGGVMAAHKAEIEAAPDPAARRAELEAHYLAMTSPFRTAEKFGVLDIIDPRETRRVLCDWVEDAWYVVRGDLAQRSAGA